MRYYDYPIPMHQDYGIWGLLLPVVMMLIVALVVIIVIRMLRGSHFGAHHHMHRDPLDIAKERYARGELTKEQYDALRKDLTV